MSAESRYREATVRAEAAKARLLSSVDDAKARMAPSRLVADAKSSATSAIMGIPNYAVRKVRQRPIATGAAVITLAAYIFRRPIGTFFGQLYVRWKNRNSESDDG